MSDSRGWHLDHGTSHSTSIGNGHGDGYDAQQIDIDGIEGGPVSASVAGGGGGGGDGLSNNDEALSVLQRRILEMQQSNNLYDQLNLMAQVAARPTEQFLTVANNGTVLGATNTVTGFPPDSMLMTSV
jgi:hypothetical protein